MEGKKCDRKDCLARRSKLESGGDVGFHPDNPYKIRACPRNCGGAKCSPHHHTAEEGDEAAAATSYTQFCRDSFLGRACKNGSACYFIHEGVSKGVLPSRKEERGGLKRTAGAPKKTDSGKIQRTGAPRREPMGRETRPRSSDAGFSSEEEGMTVTRSRSHSSSVPREEPKKKSGDWKKVERKDKNRRK